MNEAAVLDCSARWSLHQGEALAWLCSLPDGCADAIVTDPPYSITGDSASIAGRTSDGFNIPGVPIEVQFYEAWLREHLTAWRRILKPTAAIFFTIDVDGLYPVRMAAHRLGFAKPDVGIWYRKGLGMGHLLRHVHEHFVVLRMPEFQRRRADEPDVWEIPWSPSHREHRHGAEKPIALGQRAIRLLTDADALIVDPFSGSGSFGVAALLDGRRVLACERDATHGAVIARRLEGAAQGQIVGGIGDDLPIVASQSALFAT